METELCLLVILMAIGVVASQRAIYERNEYISFECPKSLENLPEDCPFFVLEVRSDKEHVARSSGYNTTYSDSIPFTGGIATDNAGTANLSCYMRCGACGDFRWVATEATTKKSTPAPRTNVAEPQPSLLASGDGPREYPYIPGPGIPIKNPDYTLPPSPTFPTFGPPTEECPEYYLGSEVITVMDQATEYRRATISVEGLTIKPFDIDIPGVTKEIVWEVLQDHTEVSEIPSHLTPVEDVITVPPGTYNASYEVRTKTIYYEPINLIVVLNGFEVPEEVPATAPAKFRFHTKPTSADKVDITLRLRGNNYHLNTCSKVVVTYHTGQMAFKADSSKSPIVFTNVPNTGLLCAKGEDGFITESCRPVVPRGGQCGGDYPQIIDHM